MDGPWKRRSHNFAAAFAVLVGATSAEAQTNDALRRDLITQAEQARDAGDHARAAELAVRAGQLRMTPSLALMIAQEQESVGHVVDALDYARRCASDASRDESLRNRERLARICRELASTLAPRIARVTVRVPSGDDSATVQVGQHSVPPAGWGVPMPVDPGDVLVRASAPDGRRFERTVHVAGGATVEVVVALAVPPEPVASLAVGAGRTTTTVSPVGAGQVSSVTSRSGAGVGPWVVAGAGVASLIVAGALWSLHGDALAERDGACDAGGCDTSAIDSDARARRLTTGTNVAIGLGCAAIAGGAAWFLIGRVGSSERRSLRPSPWLRADGAGLTIEGAL